ncbi:hypothetical protein SMSP2_00466 [Limihaloglobus sulfuriphilus]|uniref:Uncharacterized protein n=1 Tax=Limihaloglobus sulfuriphilus TaxID=1851148 RepID=A0A1Q2MBM0_9BACT|nr:hypothetical protein [Limihaloglobus sulfuriphilus]AQQ70125.1 hypothetical protein SMSP2_00466 [Limihaloglobus sulfuriphilus]
MKNSTQITYRRANNLRNNRRGSALILAVVMTTLLAIVGMIFVMVARVNESASSSQTVSAELDNAVNTVIGHISRELSEDVPGVDDSEYYDYPGDNDRWLANIEPYLPQDNQGAITNSESATEQLENCIWQQISDVTGYLTNNYGKSNYDPIKNVNVMPGEFDPDSADNAYRYNAAAKYIPEYPQLYFNEDGELMEQLADADGDGIADSKWIELEDVTTAKGEQVFAAVRVIDNCGMLNLNTAAFLDMESDTEPENKKLIDGSSLLHTDLSGILLKTVNEPFSNTQRPQDSGLFYLFDGIKEGTIGEEYSIRGRTQPDSGNDDWYEDPESFIALNQYYIWQLEKTASMLSPDEAYILGGGQEYYGREGVKIRDNNSAADLDDYFSFFKPFDVSDELSLRHRFCIDSPEWSRVKHLWPMRDIDSDRDDYMLLPRSRPYATADGKLEYWINRLAVDDRYLDPTTQVEVEGSGSQEEIFKSSDIKHLLTAYSFDRTIAPDGTKQFALNIDPTAEARLLDRRDGVPENYSQRTAEVLYYTLVKARCEGMGEVEGQSGNSSEDLDEDELIRLGQLAVNIVDMRDLDTDITCLDLRIENAKFSDPRYNHLNPDVWLDSSDDDPTNVITGTDTYVYGVETQPVISGIAIAYEPLLSEDPENPVDYSEQEPVSHYAVEIYNPFDSPIQLRRVDDFAIETRDRMTWSPDRRDTWRYFIDRGSSGIVEIPARGFIIVCDSANFWAPYIENNADTVVVQWANLKLSYSLSIEDRHTGQSGRRMVDSRVRIPGEVLISRRVENIYTDYRRAFTDRQPIQPRMVEWDWTSDEVQIKYYRRNVMGSDSSHIYKNDAWWFCAWQEMAYIGDPSKSEDLRLGTENPSGGDDTPGENEILVRETPETDLSMPFARYEDQIQYFHSTLSDRPEENDRRIEGRTILHFNNVGEISRIWAVGPREWQDVEPIMDRLDSEFTNYIDNELNYSELMDALGGTDPENPQEPTYDCDDFIKWQYYYSYEDPDSEEAITYFDDYTVMDRLKYVSPTGLTDFSIEESEVRLDLSDPRYANIFNYLTVFDPENDYIDNDGDGIVDEEWFDDGIDDNPDRDVADLEVQRPGVEWKIPGRININTAPWFVIAQLPWVKADKDNPDEVSDDVTKEEFALAHAITAYRDMIQVDESPEYDDRWQVIGSELGNEIDSDDVRGMPGFASIGELNLVLNTSNDDYRIDKLGQNNKDIDGFPDIYSYGGNGDDAIDDFEEKDLIFTRLSNNATVRSDVFTAYILVRVGVNGPQKRVIAILDRGNVHPNYDNDGGVEQNKKTVGKVKIVGMKTITDTGMP